MATTVKYGDIGKSVGDLLGRDYPVGTVKLEVTTKTPNGVVCMRITAEVGYFTR
jgi:voltage-dependent anion channel protein 2